MISATPSHPSTDPVSSRRGLIVIGAGPTGMDVVRRTAQALPVTVLDRDLEIDGLTGELDGARFLRGDGTSLLVLRDAGVHEAYALIAATTDDETNIEACRLAIDCGVPEVLCRINDPRRTAAAQAVGARVVTTPTAMAAALTAHLPGLVLTTHEVGLGQGDILQVRVMAGSPVVGQSIRDLATREYLVGAIYRDGRLIVPHGDTVIRQGDQVLLVGAPDTLHAVAAWFRLGGAQFPHQFGRSVIVWDPDGDVPSSVYDEARWLREFTRTADFLRVAAPGTARNDEEPFVVPLDLAPNRNGVVPPEGLHAVLASSPGLFVVPAARQRFLSQVNMGPVRSLISTAEAPVLIARGSYPYQRILVAVGSSPSSWRGLELAVDIARMLGSHITAVHVKPPRFIGGATGDDEAQAVQERIAHLGRLYEVSLEFHLLEGNPVRQVLDRCEDNQLLVVARRRGQTDTYFEPDVGLRMAVGSGCSALLLSGS